MATLVEFDFEGVKISLQGDVVTGQIVSTGGGVFPKTGDFTYVLWPGMRQWQDVSREVMESRDVESWKESARRHIRDRRAEAEDMRAMREANK